MTGVQTCALPICRSVSARISDSLDAATLGLYRDATPFLRNFLCKWPGPESDLYLHRDWMYIDEETSGARTHVTWVPLVDVTLENGPLQVLPGSHRFDPSRRGTHLNGPWIQQRDVIVPRLVTVTARLGQAVVMDNALVHSSLPNRSDQPRLVAAVGMRPQGQPLVHYLHTATDDALRYDVDDEFFLRITPQALMAEPPDLPVAATVSGAQLTIGPDDLGTALDAVRPADPAESATRGRWWTRRLRRPRTVT